MFELCPRQFYIALLIWSRCDVGNSKQEEIEVSSRLISSLCALHNKFQNDKEMVSEPIKTIPQGLPLLDTNCDTWARTCGKDCETWSVEKESKCKYKKERGARIVGGEDAKLEDAPWDINLRYIYDWGSTQGNDKNFSKDEIATNNVSRIKEGFRCTGIFYTRNVVITTASCANVGYEYALTRNRFVGWLARQRFLVQNWCIFKSDVNPKQTCDIALHPEYGGYKSSKLEALMRTPNNNKQGSYPRSEHDISAVEFFTAFDFKNYPHTRAIPFAQPGMEFQGKAIFAGWGFTNESFTTAPVNERWKNKKGQITKLQKIELTIVPYEPKCKQIIYAYLRGGAGSLDPNYDYSKRFICAEPADGTKQGLCLGDQGGALVCNKDGKKYVCGMRNFWGVGVNCVNDGEGMDIFLKMSYYTPWIESLAGKQTDSDLNP